MLEAGFECGLLPHEGQNASGCLCVGGDSVGDKNQPSQNGRSFIFRWKAGSAKRFKLLSQTVEKSCESNSRSGRTDFAPSSSIPKEIASHFIHPRFNI